MNCERSNCGYYWFDEKVGYAHCHYPSADPFPAPCEIDEFEEDENEEI